MKAVWSNLEDQVLQDIYSFTRLKDLLLTFSGKTTNQIYARAAKFNLLKSYSDIDRFWTFVDKYSNIYGYDGKYPTECWIWLGGKLKAGYGIFSINSLSVRAHRFIYLNIYGQIPHEHDVHHKCKIKSCVRPDHLQAVTELEHAKLDNLGKYELNKTHCKNGHEFNERNTRINKYGHRVCRTCDNIKHIIRRRNASTK